MSIMPVQYMLLMDLKHPVPMFTVYTFARCGHGAVKIHPCLFGRIRNLRVFYPMALMSSALFSFYSTWKLFLYLLLLHTSNYRQHLGLNVEISDSLMEALCATCFEKQSRTRNPTFISTQWVKEEIGKGVSESTAGLICTFLQEKKYRSSKTYDLAFLP